MKAEENKLIRFLEGHDKSFIIPVYQRNYDWKKENCKRLLEDLNEVYRDNRKSHFFGSLVVIYNDDGEGQEYIIIDGQQRVTTISLLLLALINAAKKKGIAASDLDTGMIMNEYLIGKYNQKNKIKLKPVKNDQKAFTQLFDNPDLSIPSNVVRNYSYFVDHFDKSSVEEILGIYTSIKKLDIVEIKLKQGEDDPQLIFESLNSTGLDLTEADKVRNFILMNLPSYLQDEYYEKFWNKIEENTSYDVSSFLKDYLTMKENKIPNKDRVYNSFRTYFSVNFSKNETAKLLEELLQYSLLYKTITQAKHSDSKVSELLKRLIRMEMSVTYPFLLELFHDNDKGLLSIEDLSSILIILETYILRRFMCDVPTNALNKVFMTLSRDIKKYPEYEQKYLDVFTYVLLSKKAANRFPKDDEFREKLFEKDIYNLKAKNKVFFLERLENFQNRERVDVEKMIDDNSLTIEHVMPQKLSPSWKKTLGDNWEEIHSKYLHTIGNLTLTAYNSELSNKPYSEKYNQPNGLKESRLYLNNFFSNYSEWNEYSIKDRAEKLVQRAITIWPLPATTFTAKTNSNSVFYLNEDFSVTGEKITALTFWDIEYKVTTWVDFLKKLMELLYDLEPARIVSLVEDPIVNRNNILSKSGEDLRKGLKIADNLYIEKNLSAGSIVSYVRQFLTALSIDCSEVMITIDE